MNSKGLSDLVLTVLLVVMALIGIGLAWVYIKPIFIESGKEFNVEYYADILEIVKGSVYINEEMHYVEFKVRRVDGSETLAGFFVVLEDANGLRYVHRENVSLNIFETKFVSINYSDSGLGKLKKIFILSIFLYDEEEVIGEPYIKHIVKEEEGYLAGCGNGLCELGEVGVCLADCPLNLSYSDPLKLADYQHILFIDKNNPQCSDSYTRNQALNPETPWCNIRALDDSGPSTRVQSSDIVFIREGDYSGNWNITITQNSWTPIEGLTMKAYPFETVTIRGSLNTSDDLPILYLRYINNLTINSLNFVGHEENSFGARTYIPRLVSIFDSHNVKIVNSTFFDFQGKDDAFLDTRYRYLWQGSWYYTANGLSIYRIQNLTIDSSKFRCTETPDRMGRGMNFSGNGIYLSDSENAVIQNSEFSDCSHDDISPVMSNNALIQNNIFNNRFHNSLDMYRSANFTIRNNVFYNWDIYPSSISTTGNAIEILGSSNNKIYNNLIYSSLHCGAGISILGTVDEYGVKQRSDYNEVFNNLIYAAGSSGVQLASFTIGENIVANNTIKNNIIYGLTNRSEDCIFRGLIHIYDYNISENDGYGNKFENNIIKDFDGYPLVLRVKNNEDSTYIDYNLDEAEGNFSFFSDNIGENPLFVNETDNDFHSILGSPVIDSGICIDYVNEDFDGTSRPQRDGCDIGAYELV